MSRGATGVGRIVLVDKPVDWTSFDVVRRARRGVAGKVGHAGTLDPFATGLLVVLVGPATRLAGLFVDLPKEYLVTVQFGAVSTTGDPTGEITTTGGVTTATALVSALDAFRGTQRQRVPMTSAVKVDGERLYHKAHRGETIETPEREITVYDLTLTGFDSDCRQATLLVRCSKGTYIRTLAEDLGAALGVGGYAHELRRLRIGLFDVHEALTPDELSPEVLQVSGPAVLTLESALSFLPFLPVDEAAACRVANGNELLDAPDGRFVVRGEAGLLAVYEGAGGCGRPLVVFPTPQE
jgi:tRNA pseudouridine55 synthase